jgi:hypothetical protein
MYSIKGTKDIEFNYRTSSIRKISNTEYQYHGKPNNPNLVLFNGIKRISYVADRIEIKVGNPSELIIHHSATSNFPKKAIVIFPLVVSNGIVSEVDRLLDMKMNETLDLDIGSEITDFSMEINEAQKTAYIIRLAGGLPISKSMYRPPIIEGACGLSGKESIDLKTALTHANSQGNPHNHDSNMSTDVFNKMLKGFLDTESRCYKNGDGYVKNDDDGVVSINDAGDINGAKPIADNLTGTELTQSECSIIGGSSMIGGVGGGGGGGGGGSKNQEMECFPNEGGVFNMKFHIIYDMNDTEKFIENSGRVNSTDTIINAINAEVKILKEHIEKLGGIYVNTATVDGSLPPHNNTKDEYYYYINANNAATDAKKFFDQNEKIDIFITYVYDPDVKPNGRLKTIEDNSNNAISIGRFLKKPNRANECILVAVRNGNSVPNLMSAKKFSEDYLNKDLNRYTHISIPGYMTGTENQSMKAIMVLLATMLTGSISYYTIPGFYKIAVQKLTGNTRNCNVGDDPYGNYYMVTAFNYFFVILTIILPFIIMLATNTINGILSIMLMIGIICAFTIKARYTLDHMFFYSFYPKNGLTPCNKTKDFKENQDFGSRLKVFTYIPAAISALIMR